MRKNLHLGACLLSGFGTHTPKEGINLCFRFQSRNCFFLPFSLCFCKKHIQALVSLAGSLDEICSLQPPPFSVFGFLPIDQILA